MAQKVFTSYKYWDMNVAPLYGVNNTSAFAMTKVRDYVTLFQSAAAKQGIVINKGEADGEDMSKLMDSTIRVKLWTRVYDSTVTVVFISPGMYEHGKPENQQWIPCEISYSLREQSRSDRTSHPNSLVFVILPDRSGHYEYFHFMHHFRIVSENIKNGYGEVVEWNRFIQNIGYYIERANIRRRDTPDYKIVKTV